MLSSTRIRKPRSKIKQQPISQPKQRRTLVKLLERKPKIKLPRMPKSLRSKSQAPQRLERAKNLQTRTMEMIMISTTESSRKLRLMNNKNKPKLTGLMVTKQIRRTRLPLQISLRKQVRSTSAKVENHQHSEEVPRESLEVNSVRDLMILMMMAEMRR